MKGEPSSLYYILRFFVGAATTLLLALLVLGIRLPRLPEFRKTRTAKYFLFAAFLVLGAPIFTFKTFQVTASGMFMSYLSDSICYLLMMYAPVLVLSEKYGHKSGRILAAGGALCLVMQVYFLLCFPIFGIEAAAWAWVTFGLSLAVVLYLVREGAAFFRKCGRDKSVLWFGSYYMFVAVMMIVYFQILLPSFPVLDGMVLYMKILFTLMSAIFIMRFFEYSSQIRNAAGSGAQTDVAVGANEPDAMPSLSEETEAALRESLDKWVADRHFLEQDEGVDLVAAQLGTDLKTLRTYFRTRMPSDFRTWRIFLRIEFAKERLREDPEISVNRLSEMSGFATRSNFYHYFKKITGMTPAEYKEHLS